jgi:hypothetical protein
VSVIQQIRLRADASQRACAAQKVKHDAFCTWLANFAGENRGDQGYLVAGTLAVAAAMVALALFALIVAGL